MRFQFSVNSPSLHHCAVFSLFFFRRNGERKASLPFDKMACTIAETRSPSLILFGGPKEGSSGSSAAKRVCTQQSTVWFSCHSYSSFLMFCFQSSRFFCRNIPTNTVARADLALACELGPSRRNSPDYNYDGPERGHSLISWTASTWSLFRL